MKITDKQVNTIIRLNEYGFTDTQIAKIISNGKLNSPIGTYELENERLLKDGKDVEW